MVEDFSVTLRGFLLSVFSSISIPDRKPVSPTDISDKGPTRSGMCIEITSLTLKQQAPIYTPQTQCGPTEVLIHG
jgi:hypothetical protein